MPATLGAVALAVALTGCNGSDSKGKSDGKKKGKVSSSAPAKKEQQTFRLGEASPPQKSDMKESSGATFTVTPTKVVTGTKAEMDASGLKKDKEDGPQIPVHVWSTLTHKSGKAMEIDDMDDDLVMRTNVEKRTRALIVLLGEAKWKDCPAPDDTKKLTPGQSEKICTTFLIPEGQKAAAVELTQGFYNEPLEWPVKG
ncbi:hypothetical protein [Streptomyces coffeae]|uniref:hypothetical protein n=1 Tax=Streptomyces coffeae TaxID=621382 RepID=UPI0027DB3269|nr:hypothetical protein [Streptomyces coffeae]